MSSWAWKLREQNEHFVAGALAAVVELIPTLAARALAVVVEAMVIPTLALAVVVEAVALALEVVVEVHGLPSMVAVHASRLHRAPRLPALAHLPRPAHLRPWGLLGPYFRSVLALVLAAPFVHCEVSPPQPCWIKKQQQ